MSDLMKAKSYPIADLTPYELNDKVHSESQIDQVAKSITQFGWVQPIVADKNGVIIAGHGRWLAAKKLNLKQVPVVIADWLTDAQVKALRIADNRVTSTDYDVDKAVALLREVSDDDALDLLEGLVNERELDLLNAEIMNAADIIDGDMSDVIDDFDEENEEIENDIAQKGVSLAKAFGFKTMSPATARQVKAFMAHVKEQTGRQDGAEALNVWLEELLAE